MTQLCSLAKIGIHDPAGGPKLFGCNGLRKRVYFPQVNERLGYRDLIYTVGHSLNGIINGTHEYPEISTFHVPLRRFNVPAVPALDSPGAC